MAAQVRTEELRLLRIGAGRFDEHVPAPTYPHDARPYNRLWMKGLIDARGFITDAGRAALRSHFENEGCVPPTETTNAVK